MSTIKECFSLKDHLFNQEKVQKITFELMQVYPEFDGQTFQKDVLAKFPELELMERIYWIRDNLKKYLPPQYRAAVKILLKSLPRELDLTKSDDDFGDFIYAPYGYFVAAYGCTKPELVFSLAALKKLTTRFSVEGPIRFFLNAFPKETLAELIKWTKDDHYHVRRLTSEGTRPTLPWAQKIDIPYTAPIPILDTLYSDPTRFVTRSVANHINDISKLDDQIAVQLLQKWRESKAQPAAEMDYITQHSLRTLVKAGNKAALALLGYMPAHIKVQNFSIPTSKITIGENLVFSFDIISTTSKTQQLMINYRLHFKKANGALAPKTFKITKKQLLGNETLTITKKHPLKIMSTRKLYPGEHVVELQINGVSLGKQKFKLLS